MKDPKKLFWEAVYSLIPLIIVLVAAMVISYCLGTR